MRWNMEFRLDGILSIHGQQLNRPVLPPFLNYNSTECECIKKYFRSNLESLSIEAVYSFINDTLIMLMRLREPTMKVEDVILEETEESLLYDKNPPVVARTDDEENIKSNTHK